MRPCWDCTSLFDDDDLLLIKGKGWICQTCMQKRKDFDPSLVALSHEEPFHTRGFATPAESPVKAFTKRKKGFRGMRYGGGRVGGFSPEEELMQG